MVKVHLVWLVGLPTVRAGPLAKASKHVPGRVLPIADPCEFTGPIPPVVVAIGLALVPEYHTTL